jgi:hypothetical protein
MDRAMDKHSQSRAPVILASVVLLLPLLYVGSYFALVVPSGRTVSVVRGTRQQWEFSHYRFGRLTPARVYWPLEQIDRKVRPRAWEFSWWKLGIVPAKPGVSAFLCPSHPAEELGKSTLGSKELKDESKASSPTTSPATAAVN